jgi:hypothetical protein
MIYGPVSTLILSFAGYMPMRVSQILFQVNRSTPERYIISLIPLVAGWIALLAFFIFNGG